MFSNILDCVYRYPYRSEKCFFGVTRFNIQKSRASGCPRRWNM